MSVRVVFFGTPQFAADVLEYLVLNKVEIVAVITKPDRPLGRSATPQPTPVKTVAMEQLPSIPLFQPEIVSAAEFAPIIEKFDADLFVVVAYGEILRQHLLEMPKIACINLHASLLPKYRGAAPIQQCIINGEGESGITIMHMVKKMDAGDIISKQSVQIGPDMTYGELEVALCEEGSHLLLQAIHDLQTGTASRTPQDHTQATFAAKIELEDCEIDWQQPAQQIHNLVRGVTPHPGAWCWISIKGVKKRLKIVQTSVIEELSTHMPGTVISMDKHGVLIACGQSCLRLVRVQLEGKKEMTAAELFRGFSEKPLFLPKSC